MGATVHVVVVSEGSMQHVKTAALLMVTTADRYRIGDTWTKVKLDEWIDRQSVDAINCFGRHQLERGDTLIAERIDGSVIAQVYINKIEMADTETLTVEDLHWLGFLTRNEFLQDWGRLLQVRYGY